MIVLHVQQRFYAFGPKSETDLGLFLERTYLEDELGCEAGFWAGSAYPLLPFIPSKQQRFGS